MKIYIVPIDDSSKERMLEDFLRLHGFRFEIPKYPPKTIFDCESLDEVREMTEDRKGKKPK